MSEKVYKVLKFIAQVVLPALATLIITVFTIWGLPYGESIAGTITAFDAFLGTILLIDSSNYEKIDKLKKDHADEIQVLKTAYEASIKALSLDEKE